MPATCGTRAIMAAHVLVPTLGRLENVLTAITTDHQPYVLKVLPKCSNWLRSELGPYA